MKAQMLKTPSIRYCVIHNSTVTLQHETTYQNEDNEHTHGDEDHQNLILGTSIWGAGELQDVLCPLWM